MEINKMDNIIDEELIDDVMIVAEEEEVELEEGVKGKRMCFKGIFSEADSLNANHRVYPKEVLYSVYTEAMERSKKTGKPIFGELEHASNSHINLERIAVTFPELVWNEEKGTIEGKAVPTFTEAGNTVKGLAKSGFPICFSTRMTGKVKPLTEDRKRQFNIAEDVQNCVEVLPGARLISIDVVGDPSCRKSVSKTVVEQKEETPKSNNPTFKQIFDEIF